MVATRSRVGTPQAFNRCLTSKSCYLLYCHPNKTVTINSCSRAVNVVEQIPEPFRCRECLPLPPVRTRPGFPIAITDKHPPTRRHNTPSRPRPPHAILANASIPSAVI